MARTMEDVELLSRIMFSSDPPNDYEGLRPFPIEMWNFPPSCALATTSRIISSRLRLRIDELFKKRLTP